MLIPIRSIRFAQPNIHLRHNESFRKWNIMISIDSQIYKIKTMIKWEFTCYVLDPFGPQCLISCSFVKAPFQPKKKILHTVKWREAQLHNVWLISESSLLNFFSKWLFYSQAVLITCHISWVLQIRVAVSLTLMLLTCLKSRMTSVGHKNNIFEFQAVLFYSSAHRTTLNQWWIHTLPITVSPHFSEQLL